MAAIIIITQLYFSSLEKYVYVCLFHSWKRESVSFFIVGRERDSERQKGGESKRGKEREKPALNLDAKLTRAQNEF